MLKLRRTDSEREDFSDLNISFVAVCIIIFHPILAIGQNSIRLDTGWVMQTGDNQAWASPDIDDSGWQAIQVGVPWDEAGYANYDGYGWYRIAFTVPEHWQQQDEHGFLSLSVGSVDDADVTYFNGESVGATGSMPPDYETAYDTRRIYRIPTSLVRWGGRNVIAVRVYDDNGAGGLYKGPYILKFPQFGELIGIEFKLENSNGIYFSPDPLPVTINIKNHSCTDYELTAMFELVNDRVDAVRVLASIKKTVHIDAKAEVSKTIEFAPPPPGFYRIVFTLNGSVKKTMVLGYEPERIGSPLTREADFCEFWKERKQELARVAPDFKIMKDDRSTNKVDVYLVEMQSYGNVKVRGWYTVPTTPGPHPAILSLPGYMSTMWPYVNRTNVATFALNPRGHGNSKDDVDPKGKEYMFIGFDPNRPEKYIYAGAYLDCVRAVDFLASRPEIDASRIGVEGGSQGGGLSFATAALDTRIAFCAPDIPWLGDWVGYLETATWAHNNYPSLFKVYPDLTFVDISRLLSYFDTMNLAEWITCPVLMSVALQDDVCPPRISFAPYNAVRSKKEYRVYPFAGHSVPREHRKLKEEWMAKRLGIDTIGDESPVEPPK
jgi:cephalosporin-C deacetylase